MSILIDGATYRFENRADGNRSLNVYGTSPAILANVCLWGSDDDDICQQWVYEESATENRGYLRCKGASNLYLDVYTGSGASTVVGYNAHVYTISNTAYLEVEEISGGYIRIKSMYNGRYLTANQGSGGTSGGTDVNAAGNVYFYGGGLTDNSQDWLPVRLDGDPTPDPEPDPDPGEAQTLVSPYPCAAITAGYEPNVCSCGCYPYSFHIGTDFIGATSDSVNASYVTEIKASGYGRVVHVETPGESTNLGNMVVIKYNNVKKVNGGIYDHVMFRYCHLASIMVDEGDTVYANTPIAIRGSSGAGCASNAAHLHLEVTTDPEDLADVSYSNNETGGTTIDVLDVLFNKNTTSGIGMRKTIKDTEGVFQNRAESGEFCPHGNQWYDGDAIDAIPTATNIIEE